MIRAVLKGSMLFAFGRTPGGPRLYRSLTRSAMGTQSTHVDKLKRVWPGYVQQWTDRCELIIDGAQICVYEGGWTPFPSLLAYLLTGKGGWIANHESRLHERYVRGALEAAVCMTFSDIPIPEERKHLLKTLLESSATLREVTGAIEGKVSQCNTKTAIPFESGAVDLLHSGGVLEHVKLNELELLAMEFWRALKPGGICSHVFDHRDHLYHADKNYAFLNHLRYSDQFYGFAFGHPLLFHSRVLPKEIVAIFEKIGFQTVAVRRLILPASTYVESEESALSGKLGLARECLHSRFSAASDADLCTAAAHYLFRKPS